MPRPKNKTKENLKNQVDDGPKQSSNEWSLLASNSSIPSLQDSLHDSESSKPISSWLVSNDIHEETDEETDEEFEESDLFPDPKTIFILRGGILKKQNNWKMKKNDWHYRVMDTTGEVMLVNYDLHDAVPFVKTILNETVDFPEIIILKRLQKLVLALVIVGILCLIIWLRGVTWSAFNEKISSIEKKITAPESVIKTETPSLLQIRKSTWSTQITTQ